MTLLKGGIFDNSTSTLASNTSVNLTNVFELMEDQNYIVNMSFSVFEVENLIHNFTSFGRLS